MSIRTDRTATELRKIEFIPHYTKWAEGSVLTKFGETHVLCNATIENRIPRWLHQSDKPHGWLTAEYALLPRSCEQRVQREQQWPKGRTLEISRLIGRSLRMSIDLRKLGLRQIIVDCDVLQADGGTRTAAITGGWVAVNLALNSLIEQGKVSRTVFKHQIAAVSMGIVNGEPLLDLDYGEDSQADADVNVVMTANGDFIEVQGTGEQAPIARTQLAQLLDMAAGGITQLCTQQSQLLADVAPTPES